MEYKISASILNADFLRLGTEIDSVASLVDEIHLDVMDGRFVDNISFGAPVVAGIRGAYPQTVIDTHLMISKPHQYWRDFVEIGSDIVTFHYEATDHAYVLLKQLREAGVQAGISLTPATDVRLLEPMSAFIDRILVMTVEPGFGGQSFEPQMLRKIEAARTLFGDRVDIEVDGGINQHTIAQVQSAGANVYVVGSFIFAAEDRSARIAQLREALGQ
ncbi:MAG: ribulose-phosphate 3-epimerase [Spirochaetaceae bacterium]|nr:MAG: ribulose-phosphate 3-epimerase [Spirochaetaceae bacterium]